MLCVAEMLDDEIAKSYMVPQRENSVTRQSPGHQVAV